MRPVLAEKIRKYFKNLTCVKESERAARYTEAVSKNKTKSREVNTMTAKTYQLETVTCPSCIAKIEGMLGKTGGVGSAEVLFNTSRVKVTFDESIISSEEIKSRIGRLGYRVLGER